MRTTTDVFVVTDGLLTSFNPTFTTGGTSGITNTGTTITTSNSIGTITTGWVSQQPTYNDFWRFDEEFDLLWKSFFERDAIFRPVKEKVVNHPCDIQETDNGLRIDLTAIGLEKEEIDIIVDSETLRVAYRKSEDEKQKENNEYRYLHRSIKKASFDIAWKISSKYDLQKLEAKLDKGLLTLDIPFAKENKPKKVTIK